MTNVCDKKMTFSDCEKAIISTAIKLAENKQGKKVVNSPNVKQMLKIVEGFIKKKKLLLYGGTAINALLPKQDKFYDFSTEIPDYDMYSPNALNDAKELADIFAKEGFENIEAKSKT